MKELKSPRMRALLNSGLRKAKRKNRPIDGMMYNLIYKTLNNGWHYQVEYVYDSRFYDKPYVVVYAFKPPKKFTCVAADYYLKAEVK